MTPPQASEHPVIAKLRESGVELNTRDVATAAGVSLATARRHLWAAEKRGEVEAFDGGASGREGNPILWRIAK